MIEIRRTRQFGEWLARLKDQRAVARIALRIDRLALGNPGDTKAIGEGILEMRIDYGPGYRIYYLNRGQSIIVLLAGGDKSTQPRDIKKALKLARELKKEE